jgi:hypothetical protein
MLCCPVSCCLSCFEISSKIIVVRLSILVFRLLLIVLEIKIISTIWSVERHCKLVIKILLFTHLDN